MNNKEYIIEIVTKNKNKFVQKHLSLHFSSLILVKNYLRNRTQILIYRTTIPYVIIQLISYIKNESDIYIHKLKYDKQILIYKKIPHLIDPSNSSSSSDAESNKMYDYSSSEESALGN